MLWDSCQIFDFLLCSLPGSFFLVVVGGVGGGGGGGGEGGGWGEGCFQILRCDQSNQSKYSQTCEIFVSHGRK